MNNLLSGSSGFVGTALKRRFLAQADSWSSVDRDLEFTEDDYDIFYHLAAYGNMYNHKDIDKIFDVNIFNTRTLLSLVTSKLFIYFSSSSVYGEVKDMREEAELSGSSVYAIAKIIAEYECRRFSEARRVAIVRPFSITGKGEQPTHFIPTAIRAALTGETLKLDPTPVHDFIDIEDLLDALDIIIQYCSKQPYYGCDIFNVGTGIETTNAEVVELIEQLTRRKINIVYTSGMRSYDTNHWKANILKLNTLGWKPKKLLEQSIQEQIDDYTAKEIS